jgi:hypothetical protein
VPEVLPVTYRPRFEKKELLFLTASNKEHAEHNTAKCPKIVVSNNIPVVISITRIRLYLT